MSITAYGTKSEDAVHQAENEIQALDNLLSIQNKNSEIHKLNQDKCLTVSDDTLLLFNKAIDINKKTNGAFDITTQPLSQLWGFYGGLENRVPSQAEIEKTLEFVGTEHVKINKTTVSLDNGSAVDLGGIAKGYASHKAAQALENSGVSSAVISLGGNIRTVGSKPDGTDWSIAIADPDDNSKRIGTVAVSGSAVVTSGGYQRCFEQNGKIYHHILDPKTGCPANSGLKSVTVVSEDDTLADALSTAMFVMGLEKASHLYTENKGLFEAVFVTNSNEIFVTVNLKDKFLSQRSFEVIEP